MLRAFRSERIHELTELRELSLVSLRLRTRSRFVSTGSLELLIGVATALVGVRGPTFGFCEAALGLRLLSLECRPLLLEHAARVALIRGPNGCGAVRRGCLEYPQLDLHHLRLSPKRLERLFDAAGIERFERQRFGRFGSRVGRLQTRGPQLAHSATIGVEGLPLERPP